MTNWDKYKADYREIGRLCVKIDTYGKSPKRLMFGAFSDAGA